MTPKTLHDHGIGLPEEPPKRPACHHAHLRTIIGGVGQHRTASGKILRHVLIERERAGQP
jgi:hypothetical protein